MKISARKVRVSRKRWLEISHEIYDEIQKLIISDFTKKFKA